MRAGLLFCSQALLLFDVIRKQVQILHGEQSCIIITSVYHVTNYASENFISTSLQEDVSATTRLASCNPTLLSTNFIRFLNDAIFVFSANTKVVDVLFRHVCICISTEEIHRTTNPWRHCFLRKYHFHSPYNTMHKFKNVAPASRIHATSRVFRPGCDLTLCCCACVLCRCVAKVG